jgi:hypothetical protein
MSLFRSFYVLSVDRSPSQPWIVSQRNPPDGDPSPDGADGSAQSQSSETTKTIVIPGAHLHPSIPAQLSTSITSLGLPNPSSY